MNARSSRMLRSSSTTRTRVSGMAGREGEGKGGAQARRAPNVDVPAVLLDDAVDEREPEARPLRLGREEGFEHVRDVARRNALAGIADRDLERVAANGDRDAKLAALRHRLHRVQTEIPQDLAELLGIDRPEHGRHELAD